MSGLPLLILSLACAPLLPRGDDSSTGVHPSPSDGAPPSPVTQPTVGVVPGDIHDTLTHAGGDPESPIDDASPPALPEASMLFDFSTSDAQPWTPVNDDVMGGVSRGTLRLTEDGTALFAGALSLEHNGGFSTVRSAPRDLRLGEARGLRLRVRGDGRRYHLSAMSDASRRNVHVWQATFDTRAGEWIDVDVPFSKLTHRVMGWTIPNDPIAPETIRALAFGISDKDTRPFALEIARIEILLDADADADADAREARLADDVR